MDDTLARLQKVFRRTLRRPELTLSPEMNADNIQGWDSLTHIRLLVAIEREFKIRLNTAEIAGTKNISGLIELIGVKVGKTGSHTASPPRRPAHDREPEPVIPNLGMVVLDASQFGGRQPVVARLSATAGSLVEKDDPIFDAENSKATHEFVSPAAGILAHALAQGDVLPLGKAVALILPAEVDQASVSAAIGLLRKDKPAIKTSEGLPSASRHQPTGTSKASPIAAQLPRKLEEIRVLSGGAGNTMLSVIGTRLGPLTISREIADSFFADKILDFVAYEAARLMRRFPKLNASYRDGSVEVYDAVNVGVAFDEGERLVVYGLADADKKSLHEIRAEIEDALAQYMRRELTPQQLTRATFTITDVSALNLDFTFPILPEGQACIIGITRNGDGEFGLFMGYDHRVTEGLQAAKFLQELRLRVASFETKQSQSRDLRCSFCEKSVFEEAGSWRGRGLLKLVDANGEDVLACHSCWSGW